MSYNNNYRSGGRNNRNNRNFGNNQNFGNRRDRNDQQRGPRNANRFRNNRNQNRDREKKEAGVTIRYEKGKISEEKVKHSFIVYGDTHETKVNTHEYIGSSDEELLTVVKEIWKIVDEYELLPVEENNQGEQMAPGREREPTTVIIGIGELPVPAGNANARATEVRRRERARNANRRIAFRMVSNILKDQTASKSFEDEINEQRQIWEAEEAERAEQAQEEAIAAALAENPNMNPEDVPVAGMVPKIFLCQRTLERCLNKVIGDILPTDAVLQQEQFMKNTTKPKKLSAKQWINRLEEMKEMMYWMDSTNYKLDRRTFNIECIAKNLPLEWKIEFERADISTKIKRNVPTLQPKNFQIIAQLEQIERAEVMKKEIESVRNRRNNNGNKNNHQRGNQRNGRKNMCRKPGHNHEWKDCPDNPRNKNNHENNANERDDSSRDEREIEDREFNMMEEADDDANLIENDEEAPTLFEEDILPVKKEENNIVNNIKAIKKYPENDNNSRKVKVSCVFTLMNEKGQRNEYLGLLDTGSTKSLISEELVKKYKMEIEKDNGNWNTNTGQFRTNKLATANNMTFPQWSSKRVIETTKLAVNPNAKQKYKAIFGLDFLLANKFDVLFSKAAIEWEGISISMFNKREPRNQEECNKLEKVTMQENKYSYMDAQEITHLDNQKHLSVEEKGKLEIVLREFNDLFEGKVGTYTDLEIEFELKPEAKPYYGRPYNIPVSQLPLCKAAIKEMVDNGVLREVREDTEWAAQTFFVPKKTPGVRTVSDFRALNSMIKRSPWPMPSTRTLLHQIGGMTYVTALDQIMSYYTMNMSKKVWEYLTIILPFGKYQYMKMPMGLKISADVFQREMSKLFEDLSYVLVYIDDLLIVTKGSYEDHLEKLKETFRRLQKKGVQLNAKKSYFATQEVEYLGYIINRNGIKPQQKKVQAILRMQVPKTVKQLRGFIGLVNFYRDLWRRRAHHMAPLTKLISQKKGPIKWNEEANEAFKKIKEICAEDALLYYPDYNRSFVIHIDASDYQMGGVISQDEKAVAYWSKKLSGAQKNYTTTEKELLAITELLKEFRNMLYGQEIIIYTDHANLAMPNAKFNCQRVLRQRLTIEEFGPKILHISGEKNVAADTLSRIDFDTEDKLEANFVESHKKKYEMFMAYEQSDVHEEIVPINYEKIHTAQRDDVELKELQTDPSKKDFYGTKLYGKTRLWMKKSKFDKKWRIFVPKSIRHNLIEWYHEALMHPGIKRMEESVLRYFTWPGCTRDIAEAVKTCGVCQKNKNTNNGRSGKIPMKDNLEINPWEVLSVDLVGPWKTTVTNINNKQKEKIQISALTMMDEATGWLEIVPIMNKQSKEIALLMDSEWFCRYPRPYMCRHDNGGEFDGAEFQELLESYGIKSKPTTVKNPQGNGMHERVHLLIAEMLRTQNIEIEEGTNKESEVRRMLQSVAFAVRTAVSSVTQYAPSHLVYGRDMIIHEKELINWHEIWKRRTEQSFRENIRENKKRSNHEYRIGDKVLVITKTNERGGKLIDFMHKGPYEVTSVYKNGTIKVKCNNFKEIIHIRRVKPFHEKK